MTITHKRNGLLLAIYVCFSLFTFVIRFANEGFYYIDMLLVDSFWVTEAHLTLPVKLKSSNISMDG